MNQELLICIYLVSPQFKNDKVCKHRKKVY